MRLARVSVLCVSLVAAVLSGGVANAAPQDGALAPGKPAGVDQAQLQDNTPMLIGAAGLLGVGMGLALSGSDKNDITSTSTSTTGTTP